MAKKKKKSSAGRKIWRTFKWLLLLALVAGAAAIVYVVFFVTTPDRDVWDFVPENTVFVVEADDPIENWKSLSATPMWQHLKTNELFADIEGNANYLDTLIHDNGQIFDLMANKKVLICAMMTRAQDYDFTYLVDLEQGSKVALFIDLIKPIMSGAGFPMNEETLGGRTIYALNDGADDLYMAFIDNVLAISYSKKLLLKTIEVEKKPFYSRNSEFVMVREGAEDAGGRSSIARIHLNFDQLDEYMGVFLDEVTGTVTAMSESMQYASMDLKVDDEYAAMAGLMSVDTADTSLAEVLLRQERSEVLAPRVLPVNTSFLLSINFHDFDYFYESIAELMEKDADFQSFERTKDRIGGFLGFNKNERKRGRAERKGKDVEYFDWMGQEISLAMMPKNESGSQQSYVALFHSPDFANASRDLAAIAKQIRKRTPVRFKDYTYRGIPVRWLAMKGFFKLFLGKMFKQFDKPKYVVLEEFVVFSNDTTALHRVVDATLASETLYGEENYRRIGREFSDRSNYYIYAATDLLYNHLPTLLDDASARDLRKNEAYVRAFPYLGLQLTSDDNAFDAQLYLEYKEPAPVEED